MRETHTGDEIPKKEVSGIWVLLIFVVLLGGILTIATVTR